MTTSHPAADAGVSFFGKEMSPFVLLFLSPRWPCSVERMPFLESPFAPGRLL